MLPVYSLTSHLFTEQNVVWKDKIQHLRIPSQVSCVDEEDTSPGHSGRCCRSQVTNFKQQSHWRGKWDTLITGQGEHLVVIHDGVQGLNPHGINVTIQNDPFRPVGGHIGKVSHDDREQTCIQR